MGTPDFAEESLRALLEAGEDVTAVFTQPDKPRGRGMRESFSPVKALAAERGIPVYQPVTFKDGAATELLRTLAPELLVVVAYGRILPQAFLDVAKYGSINVHGSLLPKYRGAAPIQWSVINGDAVTGVTAMYMAEGMDTGDMILKLETEIGENETSGELFERLASLGADSIEKTLELFDEGSVPREPQNEAQATMAPMLKKEMGELDFTKSANEIHNLVRGLCPWPVAFTFVDGKSLKVYKADRAEGFCGEAGTLLDEKRFIVGCGDGAVELVTVQPEGKKQMSGGDFIRGKRLAKGTHIGR